MRRKAYRIVYEVMEQQKHSDVIFHTMLESDPSLEGKDKRFIKRLSYGTIERVVELDAYIRHFSKLTVRQLTPSVRTVLRMAVYELLYMDKIPQAVSCHEAVELLKGVEGERYAGYVNGVLRAFLRNEENLRLRPYEALCLPKNLYQYLIEKYGKKTTKKIAQAFLERQGEITLHIDTNKISCEQYEENLKKHEIDYQKGNYVKEALIVRNIEDVKRLPGYDEGYFFVQDESSMLPSLCAGICPGQTVVDVCAAPGGKTMSALIQLRGEGILSYRDVNVKKVSRIRENLERFGYKNVEGKVWDGTKEDPDWREKADVVLADVPCSGIGIIGKKPEIRYHAMQETESLVPIQQKICESSAAMLRKGGVFIYSTCTINEKENEQNVAWIEEHCGMKCESLDPFIPEILQNRMTAEGSLQILPGIHQSDGFFVARLKKQ